MNDVKRNTLSTSIARKELADILNRASYAHERTIVTRNGKPVAAIVSLEDLEAMEALEDQMDLQAARRSLKDAKAGGGTKNFKEFLKERGIRPDKD